MEDKKDVTFFIECKDHTVSGECFKLYHNASYDMLVTSPKPDLENLKKYYESEDYISHTDSKRSLFEKVYHMVKKYSLSKKVKLISQLNRGTGTLLDIGAGTGDFLVQAKKERWQVVGVEPNEQAKVLAKGKGVTLKKDTSNFETARFDVITLWHVLEHIPDLENQIVELKRLLKPGGHIVIAVPNYKSYDAKYYKSYWAAYDVPRHLWHFSKKSIKKLFDKEGICLEKVIPLKFDSFYVSLLSEKYKNGNMNFIKSFWIGCLSNSKAKTSKEYSSHIYVLKKE
ncbi:class I SAM-dependent methyltransferase [Aquimarina sp. RZ0]|uniref:class I SAM-dependent methyltransferase n=1 Tax=Aquimarina sp. RZ0 TaxID=2607730 RepID=UPI0011F2CAB0|nr:class I SAM-dependent methyltransferase [Aquimarina sp. RZ0]KAA1247357.1 class I SAM-dependent methyltransferase [Aquimarina sp. RZ0]